MHLAAAAVTKVVGAGLGKAAAAAGGATASSIGSTALTVLQGVAAGAGILGQMGAANAAARASEDAAAQAELEAGQEKVDGTNQQASMKRELMRILGENEVATAAAGIDISAGIGAEANATAKRETNTNISVSRNDQEFRSALHRLRAQGLQRKANSQRQAGLLSAIGSGANFGISLYERG